MAYAAVISLDETIHRLLNSSQISIASSDRKKIKNVHRSVKSIKEVVKRLDDSSRSSERLDVLDGQLRDAAHKFEDFLEFHESDQFVLQSERHRRKGRLILSLELDSEQVWQEIKTFAKTAKKIEEDYIKELDNPSPAEDDDRAVSSSYKDFGVQEMVGYHSNQAFAEIKDRLLKRMRPDDFGVFSIVGVPGTGRTAVARAIFEDLYRGDSLKSFRRAVTKNIFEDLFPRESRRYPFDCGAWVTIGPKYKFKEILLNIISQIDDGADSDEDGDGADRDSDEDDDGADNDNDEDGDGADSDEEIFEYLHTSLKGRRYIIVLDDVCDKQVWEYSRKFFPEQDNGSVVLLTTELMEVAQFANGLDIFEMTVFDENQIWDFLRQAMFGKKTCPPELEEAGKKIAKNCEGRRLALAKVSLFLLELEKTPEYWHRIAADKQNSVFVVADEISEICQMEKDHDLQQRCSFLDDDQGNGIADVVDLSDFINVIKEELFPERFFRKMEIILLLGMAGIGKTALAKKVFEDPSILSRFDHHVRINLGPNYKPEEILVDILAQIYPNIDETSVRRLPEYVKNIKGYSAIVKDQYRKLFDDRCLIVLDDVWDETVLSYLRDYVPDIKGKVLVSTRLEKIMILDADKYHQLPLLNEEESWLLFCQKVFGKGSCPPELEKAGKKISENCEGLPLLILTVADLLSETEMTPEYWNKVALKQNPVFMNAHNEISKALRPSYKRLPQYLQACFLYMGVFPQKCGVPTSKLIKLWCAEGLLEPDDPAQTVEEFALHCVMELCYRSLVMEHSDGSGYNAKTYVLHSIFWHLSNSEAVKNKFFHALDSYVDESVECIKSHRRLCVRNSISWVIQDADVRNSKKFISNARSLLFVGPPHQYPVPIYLGMRLLRVLDALTIRFFELPDEVLKLIHLRYLALTCDRKLPSSISKLRYLQYLIVSRYICIKSSRDSLYLPVEIWDMKELKHLQIMGSILPDPNDGALLPNLLTLLDVSAHSCTKKVLDSIPNLKKLGVQLEFAPDDNGEPFGCLNGTSILRTLESLKYILVNPELGVGFVAPPAPVSMFPSGLKKLTLSGLGYPWKYMRIIGRLPKLEVLKLRCYAFRGPEWEVDNSDFKKLKFLLIEDTDLVRWNVKMLSFRNLRSLHIKHCYKLVELPRYLSYDAVLIEVVDCNPLVRSWAKQMEEKDTKNVLTIGTLRAQVQCSWDAPNHKK